MTRCLIPASGLCKVPPGLPHAGRCGLKAGRISWNDSGESVGKCSGRHVWDLLNIRTGIHTVQNSNFPHLFLSGFYRIILSIPKYIFNKDYPNNPKTYGEKIKKARMDAGLHIKELASLIGVTEDTIINWEKRNIMPSSKNMKGVERFINCLSHL